MREGTRVRHPFYGTGTVQKTLDLFHTHYDEIRMGFIKTDVWPISRGGEPFGTDIVPIFFEDLEVLNETE